MAATDVQITHVVVSTPAKMETQEITDKAAPFVKNGETLSDFNQFPHPVQVLGPPPAFVPAKAPDPIVGLIDVWKKRLADKAEIEDTHIDRVMHGINKEYPGADPEKVLAVGQRIMDLVIAHNKQIRAPTKKVSTKPVSVPAPAPVRVHDRDRRDRLKALLGEWLTKKDDDWVIQNCATSEQRQELYDSLIGDHAELIMQCDDSKFIQDQVGKLFDIMATNRYANTLLIHEANQKKECRRQELEELEKENAAKMTELDLLIEKAMKSMTHDDIANLIVHIMNGPNGERSFRCISVEKKVVWVYYNPERLWVQHGEDDLINDIMLLARPILEAYHRDLIKQITEAERTGQEAKVETLGIDRKKLYTLMVKCQTVSVVKSVATLVRPRIYDKDFIDKLDSNPDLLALMDGQVINLRTGEVRDRAQEDYCTFACRVRYDPNARSKDIDDFLDNITLGRRDLLGFLQGLFGLALTGYTHTQQLYILYGGGANGKSTLMQFMERILGLYAVQADKEVFIKLGASRSGPKPEFARLRGRRLVSFSEIEFGDKLNEATIRALTGGEKITARELYQNTIEFTPRFKLFILVNDYPEVSTNDATWRRLVCVPFDCKFVYKEDGFEPHERKRDGKFTERMLADENAMSTFFNWLVEGARRMYTEPLNQPECVTNATTKYKEDQDIWKRFIDTRLEAKDGAEIDGNDLYHEFVYWCKEDEGIHPQQKRPFYAAMRKHMKDRHGHHGAIFLGYKIHNQSNNQPNNLVPDKKAIPPPQLVAPSPPKPPNRAIPLPVKF